MDRRSFIRTAGIGSVVMTAGNFPLMAMGNSEIVRLTILHTNDVHSRIDPFPLDGSRNEGMGGAARRAARIMDIRNKEKNVLLLDAGDILQGTPFYNFFGGELEFKLMSKMNYDAATIGNHDFDGGLEGLNKVMPLGNFPLLISNYNFKNTLIKGKTKPYQVFIKDGIRIGVFGLGIELDGLVPKKLYGETQYLDPVKTAQKYASLLRNEEKCDLVICLSHLGYKFRNEPEKICDASLAQMTSDIDIITGGHTHTFMRTPDVIKNKVGKEVIVNQAGWAGIMLGRLDVYFERSKKEHCVTCKNTFLN